MNNLVKTKYANDDLVHKPATMFNARSVFVLLSLLHCWLPTTSANCWNKIGTDRNVGQSFDLYQPCSANSSAASMCCRLPGPNGQDTCQSNGLCKDASGQYWRESCTDRSWQSPNCIKLCVDGSSKTRCSEQSVKCNEWVKVAD